MIKLKDLIKETTISMGQVYSNPYATSFKSPEQIVKERVARPMSYRYERLKMKLNI